jgi:3-oxoacyl-[acyl-carrier protein] reductase
MTEHRGGTEHRGSTEPGSAAEHRVALVTGGSRGIGRAVSRALAERGCHVIVNYHQNQAVAEHLSAELHSAGLRSSVARADVSDAQQVVELLKMIRAEHGRLDVLVNSAGILEERLVLFSKPERFWEIMQTNLGGTFNVCKSAAPLLAKNRSGRIVNLSSIAASHGTRGLAAYACSKAAVEALTKVLARELAGSGIRVNAIAPGLIETEMTDAVRETELRQVNVERQPVTRIGQPEEVARLVTFLALDAPDYLTGEVIRLDGGAAIA